MSKITEMQEISRLYNSDMESHYLRSYLLGVGA
jgi:hypothetical protein